MPASITRDSDKFMLRLPDGMRERLKREAAANNRSMNSEIVARLESSLAGPFSPQEMTGLMRELKETLERVQAAESIIELRTNRGR